MKRTILSLTLCFALASGMSLMAASQNEKVENEQCTVDGEKCKKDNRKGRTECKFRDGETCGRNEKRCHNAGGERDFQCFLPGPGGERPCNRKEVCDKRPDLFEGIELTPDQKLKVKELKAKRGEKRDKERKKMAEKRDKMRKEADKKRKQIRADYEKDLAKVLTPAQIVQYKQNMEKAKESRKVRGDGPKGRFKKCDGIDKSRCSNVHKYRKPSLKEVQPAPKPAPMTNPEK